MLRRYWLEFWRPGGRQLPTGLKQGCGVTAESYEDALRLVKKKIFVGQHMPLVDRIIVDVDVSTLDHEKVLPHMWAPIWRGIWFPLGFQDNREPDEEAS